MANIYVRSTDGNDADNGSTWALAKATLGGALAIENAGDVIYLSQVHSESNAGAQNLSIAGTSASPVRIICGNDGAEPPTASSTAAVLATTTTSGFNIAGVSNGSFYMYGLTFNLGSGASAATLQFNATNTCIAVYDNCNFNLVGTGAGTLQISSLTTGCNTVVWRSCNVKFSANTQAIVNTGNGASTLHWQGGSFSAGTSSPNTANNGVFSHSGNANSTILVEDVDFSNLATGVHLHNGSSSATGPLSFTLRNCKLPSGWSGNLVRQSVVGCSRYSLYNCSAGSQNYKLWIETYEGTIRDDTTNVRSNGATDGTTPLSWKLTSSANVTYPAVFLLTDEIFYFASTVGSSVTLTLHILHDSATNLTDGEIWIETSYLGSSATPLGTFAADVKADPLATAADQTASLAVWNTTGLANPNKQQLSVTFTPNMIGFYVARVALAKASKTVWVCPKFEVT